MALIDAVKRVCTRLAKEGWRALFAHHGLDITAPQLAQELSRPLTGIDRLAAGFEDFSLEGTRGIEPGNPARSLLYHAFASPNVVANHQGKALTDYPTLTELEVVENYVFGVQTPSLAQLRALAGGNIAVAVVAHEYRTAPETSHRRHADLCFSRTGISRVGTKPPQYDAKLRGFLPFAKSAFDMRVLPARYAAYLVAQWKGNTGHFSIMNRATQDPRAPQDDDLDFWVPLQKLFDGTECLSGFDLKVSLATHHRNEKLRRIHLAWGAEGGLAGADLTKEPFVIEKGLAALSTALADGKGLLCPIPHPLVEAATYEGKPLTFHVPRGSHTLSSSIYIPDKNGARNAPEFVHARHLVDADGKMSNLNGQAEVAARVAAGGYRAQHYVDYTADGWIEASCPQLASDVPRFIPAYSIVTAPDFFVSCDQRELWEWFNQSVPTALRKGLWREPPLPLSDQRFPPNLALTEKFVKEDKTATAIVSLPSVGKTPEQATRPDAPSPARHSHLPDAAAGLFDPGWDVSRGSTHGVAHLAAYGLGSPFPEDAKLCAALSTFWPAVAPDAARSFEPNPRALGMTPTVAPLTDQEVGLAGGTAWDGLPPPKVVKVGGVEMVEYADFAHADYVDLALAGKFSLALTGQVDTREYQARILAMARAYSALSPSGGSAESQWRKKSQWGVLSVLRIDKLSSELTMAQKQSGAILHLPAYRFELYLHGGRRHPTDFRKIHVVMHERTTLFVSEPQVIFQRGGLPWRLADGL